MTNLFEPLRAGDLNLNNRVVMAALTRARAGRTHIPNVLMAEYYSARARAGLIITEATMIASDGCAFTGEGGLFDEACVKGWRTVTDAVHQRGGKILVQLWHPGRAAHSLLNNGVQPISSTDRAIRNDTIHTPDGAKPYEIPRRLDISEIPGIIAQFRAAAARSSFAGFDGVQLHAAHGYLLDQFLRDSVNDRIDAYGGSIENRARLLLEVVDAVGAEIGLGRISVRISPLVSFNDISDSNATELVRYLAHQLTKRQIAFLELRQSDFRDPAEHALAQVTRQNFPGALFVNGAYDFESSQAVLATGSADAVVFGRPFIANPDLVARFSANRPLNAMDPKTLYTPGPAGYTDYPLWTGGAE